MLMPPASVAANELPPATKMEGVEVTDAREDNDRKTKERGAGKGREGKPKEEGYIMF
ncbi:hypothetical protein GW17_00045203 [Ensete ventricosum]|nr:hypothetical protein GW17_00045203 [Ensete ventricosum]